MRLFGMLPEFKIPGVCVIEGVADAGAGGGAPAAGAEGGGPSAAEILAFDPFSPPSSEEPGGTPAATPGSAEPKTPAEAPAPGGEKPKSVATPPAAAPGATPATAIPATPAVPQPAPNMEQLLREQTELIRSAVARPAASPAAPTEPEKPHFNLAIPPQILAGMRSEDPQEFATSMHAVINGIANHIRRDFISHLETVVQPSYRNMIQEQLQGLQVQASVAQDFYGKHSNLNNPALRPIIQQAGVEVAQARAAAGKSLGWSEELRDEIAERIYTLLPQLRPVEDQPQVPVVPGAKPRFVNGGSARPAIAPNPTEDFGADLLK